MTVSTFFVNGSKLKWTGAQTFEIQGAVPSSNPFSAQPSGRVWVASATSDTALYYSDENGTTRFIGGTDVGASSQAPGRIFVTRLPCPADGTREYDLYWVSEGPSGNRLMYARAQGMPSMNDIEVIGRFELATGTTWRYSMWTNGYVPLVSTMSIGTSSLASYAIRFYTGSDCTGDFPTFASGTLKWLQDPGANTNLTMSLPGPPVQQGSNPATPWYQSRSLDIATIEGIAPSSVKIEFPTASFRENMGAWTDRPSGSIFCNTVDRVTFRLIGMNGISPATTCLTIAGAPPPPPVPPPPPPPPPCACVSNICSKSCPEVAIPCNTVDDCLNVS